MLGLDKGRVPFTWTMSPVMEGRILCWTVIALGGVTVTVLTMKTLVSFVTSTDNVNQLPSGEFCISRVYIYTHP